MCAFWAWSGRKEGDIPLVAGYVLAGGKSSRMGTNKALLPLGGKPLIEHAVRKLSRLCSSVKILSNDPTLSSFGALVHDRHPDCGPMAGIEAALLDSNQDWTLILPVDVPFLTTDYLDQWLWAALHRPGGPLRLAMLSVDAIHHPTLLIIHRDFAPYLTASLEQGRYKLFPALEAAAAALASRQRIKPAKVFWNAQYDDFSAPRWRGKPDAWRAIRPVYPRGFDQFANLNTPEDFAQAEILSGHLDT